MKKLFIAMYCSDDSDDWLTFVADENCNGEEEFEKAYKQEMSMDNNEEIPSYVEYTGIYPLDKVFDYEENGEEHDIVPITNNQLVIDFDEIIFLRSLFDFIGVEMKTFLDKNKSYTNLKEKLDKWNKQHQVIVTE